MVPLTCRDRRSVSCPLLMTRFSTLVSSLPLDLRDHHRDDDRQAEDEHPQRDMKSAGFQLGATAIAKTGLHQH